MDPVAVTLLEVPERLKVKPFPELDWKEHEPLPEPAGDTVIVHRESEVGPSTWILESVEANPLALTVTVTPLGPWDGFNVRLRTVPVKVAV